ncbi:MAG: heat-inducible transcriptional repressor HrcA [Lachnospiraceae bacterium]|nr:heat-inducible transcriptional repressor HrcA [Lachnospiraceae bacterium]
MELDERKLKILQAVVRNYLATGEPVGSRTISKYTDLNLSSATIRNEMADLEELGLIFQPHTSAGRIPSDKGYRLYVDTLMSDKIKEVEVLKEDLVQKADKMENILQNMAKLLAQNTNYTSMISSPLYTHKKVKFIQLTEMDEHQLLLVIVLNSNAVKNRMITSDVAVDKEVVLKLNILLNSTLQGLDLTEINMAMISKIKDQAGEYAGLITIILDAIAKEVGEDDTQEIYTSGATNIFKYPELTSSEKASELLYTIEEKKELGTLLSSRMDEEGDRGIQVYIGNETTVDSMKDCSVVTATYEVEEGVYGKIGIVGPKRMDYEKVVSTLHSFMHQLDDIFKKDEKKDEA